MYFYPRVRIGLFLFIFLTAAVSAQAVETNLQQQTMDRALYALETNTPASGQQTASIETKKETFMGGLKGFTQSFKANGGYLDFGLRFGYIYGQNSYMMNHHVSELEFPFRAYMGGGNIDLGYKNFSINSVFWGSLFDDPSAGWHTKDKDWDGNGMLESYTKSYSDMNATIWDANMRYNIFNYSFGRKKTEQQEKKSDNIKLGLLIGYRYERFGYKDYGLYQIVTSADMDNGYGDGQMVSEYKVKYRLPYYGLAADIGTDRFGARMKAKYAFSPRARDYDNHDLRSLHFRGDYKKKPSVIMADFTLFWKFCKAWEASIGADATLIRMDGLTWEEDHQGEWDEDLPQSIDTQQFIYWLGLGYRF